MQNARRREPPLRVCYPNCAGIDVGKKELYVAVAEDAAAENVRTFGTYTASLQAACELVARLWRGASCDGSHRGVLDSGV